MIRNCSRKRSTPSRRCACPVGNGDDRASAPRSSTPTRAMTIHGADGRCGRAVSSRASPGAASNRASASDGIAGWWNGPTHSAYNPLLTPKPLPPMIGLIGLLKLLEVVTRLQAAQQNGACAPQEAGVPCLSSQPKPTVWPALPPAHEDSRGQSLGPDAASQSATAVAPARSPRRTAVEVRRHQPSSGRRGGHP